MGSLSLLQGIFPTQGSSPGLLHCKQILYQLSHQGSPRILEWVAYPFSSGTSWPGNTTRVSCVGGRFFTNWAIREAQEKVSQLCPTLWPHGLSPARLLCPWDSPGNNTGVGGYSLLQGTSIQDETKSGWWSWSMKICSRWVLNLLLKEDIWLNY